MTFKEQLRQFIAPILAYEHGARRANDRRALAQIAARFEIAALSRGLRRAAVQLSHMQLADTIGLDKRQVQRIVHRLAETVGLLIEACSGSANMYRLDIQADSIEPIEGESAGATRAPVADGTLAADSKGDFISTFGLIPYATLDHHPSQ
jgi:hypothetical protein